MSTTVSQFCPRCQRFHEAVIDGRQHDLTPFLIYGLRDPRTMEIRYVGQTASGLHRFREHQRRSMARQVHNYRNEWLQELRNAGFECEAVVLQVCVSRDELNSAERAWIAFGRSAGTLTNVTNGGHGTAGYVVSQGTKEKLRAATLRHLSTHPHNCKGTKRSLATKEKIRIKALGRKHSPETIEKFKQISVGKKFPRKATENARLVIKGKKKSAEVRRRIRLGAFARWARQRADRVPRLRINLLREGG